MDEVKSACDMKPLVVKDPLLIKKLLLDKKSLVEKDPLVDKNKAEHNQTCVCAHET